MFEEQVNKKLYYQNLIPANDSRHPVELLGEAYINEQQKELGDLSYIRFAQGELYFHCRDYEAAIFKWENINNDLKLWAKKNIADAYLELGIYSSAEEIYKRIETESTILKMEVAIKLFSLYEQEQRSDLATQMIKEAVEIDPDYTNVTERARKYFEQQQDWPNALELAVGEAIRTELPQWVETIIDYVDNGHTKGVNPDYFTEVLSFLMNLDDRLFERLTISLWNSFKLEKTYFRWLKEFHSLLEKNIDMPNRKWKQLSALYQETYLFLLSGKFFLKEVATLVPGLLTGWKKIVSDGESAFASSAILAWNELFPGSLDSTTVDDAESMLHQSKKNEYMLENSINLFDAMVQWAEQHDIIVNSRHKWAIRHLNNLDNSNVLIAGDTPSGMKELLGRIVGESDVVQSEGTTIFSYSETKEHLEMNDSEVSSHPEYDDEMTDDSSESVGKWLEMKYPNRFLGEHLLTFIQPHQINGSDEEALNIADSMLFFVNERDPLLEMNRELLMEIQKKKPELPFHFVLIKNSSEYSENYSNIASVIQSYFPKASLFTFVEEDNSWKQLDELGEFINGTIHFSWKREERISKILYFIRQIIGRLLKKRVEIETDLIDTINSNKKLIGKMNGAVNQLQDMKYEKVVQVKKAYISVKDEIRREIMHTIPDVLTECADIINEKSDFRKMHLELNEEMNNRISETVTTTILPRFHQLLVAWLEEEKEDLLNIQGFLEEMSEGFNEMFDVETIKLNCDLRIFEDWRRDADRLTSHIVLDNINIFKRNSLSQLLLKSAGKLYATFSQNKAALAKKYKQAVESTSYKDIAELVSKKVVQQFELFESGLERDIAMFFKTPDQVLNEVIDEAKKENHVMEARLKEMDDHPEEYSDPLTLFELRLVQYEWMILSKNAYQYS